MSDVVLSAAEVDRRIIPPEDFAADDEAFVDVRLPNSGGKLNYSIIGPGVSQNPDQHVNISELHGFNVGAAGVPPGCVNNQHLHFTAEVFVSTAHEWEIRVGIESDQTFIAPPKSIVSAPTWMFRGFKNVSDEDGILYAVLGGDDTGGIVWSPKVLQQAALTGLYLRADNTLLDTEARDEITDDSKLIGPMSEKDIAELRLYTDVELRGRMVTQDDLVWSDRALLDSVLPGHASELAPVIGWGMTMDRNHVPPITNPHTFSLEWLRTPAGNAVGFHRHHDTQVLMSVEGEWQITFNRGDDQITRTISSETFVSIPRGVWRSFANVGEADALMLVVNGTDNRNLIGWDDSIVSAAEAAGWAVDASGYLAAGRVLTRQAR